MEGKNPLKSKTIRFHTIMVLIESAIGGLQMWQGILDPMTFAAVATILGVAQSVIGVKLRYMTSEPIAGAQ